MGVGEAWAAEADLENRDPNELNAHLKLAFEDILAEPDHTHSLDCVWKYSFKCFNLWKTLCYVIATTLCGVIHGMCWGCEFACIAFVHIWDITPCFRVIEIQMACYQRLMKICLGACLEPCCEACGAIFSAFKKQ